MRERGSESEKGGTSFGLRGGRETYQRAKLREDGVFGNYFWGSPLKAVSVLRGIT